MNFRQLLDLQVDRTASRWHAEAQLKTEEETLLGFEVCRLGKQKSAPSELYFVTCRVQSFETVGDRTRPVPV